ncbi:MAG: glutamine transporter periplasmic glutamine-binding protein GlnH [Bacteroidetes bacterium]|nr:glutamine transporter periplasmic glutamine-binding protein GlnH [Bacteroidota bacterium]
MVQRTKIVGILLLILLLVSAILLFVFLPSTPRDIDKIQKKGEIRIAVRMNQIDCMMRGDTLAGFQYELAKLFSDSCLHVRIKWVRVPDVIEAIRLLKQGKVDLIAQNIPRSTDVLQYITISSPILVSKAVLVQRKSSEIEDDTTFVKNQLNLGKKQLCIVRGSSYTQRIQHLAEEISDTIYVSELKVHDAEELILLVAKGSVRYGVCDEKVANYFVKRFPGIDVSVDIGFPQLQGWGINKRSLGLSKAVNSWLEKFTKSDRFNLLYAKYYN